MKKKRNDCKNSKDISGPFSGVVGSVGSLPRQFPMFNFFCLLVSSVSDFRPDTVGAVVDTFFSLFWGPLFSRAEGREGRCNQIALSCAHSVSAPLYLSLLMAHKPLLLYDAQPGTV